MNEDHLIAAAVLAGLNQGSAPQPQQRSASAGGLVGRMSDQKPPPSEAVTAVASLKPAPASSPVVKKRRGRRAKVPQPNFPGPPPVVIQTVKKPKTFENHSYRDFSQTPPELDFIRPTCISQMSFSQKVHDILSDPNFHTIIGVVTAWAIL